MSDSVRDSEAILVGDRFECVIGGGPKVPNNVKHGDSPGWLCGHVYEVVAVVASGCMIRDVTAGGRDDRTGELRVREWFRRLPREGASPIKCANCTSTIIKAAVTARFVCTACRWFSSDGVTWVSPAQTPRPAAQHEVELGQAVNPGFRGFYGAVPRESSPDILGPAETQALIVKCSATVAAQEKRTVSVTYQPCRLHNMPMPCVECSLNARYAQERGRANLDAMYVESVLAKRAAEQLHAALPVIRPWAMMDGVQGPGWNRR